MERILSERTTIIATVEHGIFFLSSHQQLVIGGLNLSDLPIVELARERDCVSFFACNMLFFS